jgi:thiol-disulfide isomerase/thioredoxin
MTSTPAQSAALDLRGCLAVGLLALSVLVGAAQPAGEAAAQTRGISAPEFHVVTFSGETYTKAALDGRATLFVFWAPWCKICQRELPVLGEFYQTEKPPLHLLSIGFADTRANVEAFVKGRPTVFVFPTAYDEGNRMAQDYRITATPTSVLVDAQGQVVLIHRGGNLLQNVQFREFVTMLKG